MKELLNIKGLWGGYKEGVDILRGINFSIGEGESVGVIGLNGSGKSTFGKAIMNMIPIRWGEIHFNGEDITTLPTSDISLRGIAIMQQGGQIFQTLSVWDNIQLALSNHSGISFKDLQPIIPILSSPKRELQRQMADKLSGGQKHQLALAMALATNPRLLILDEPSAGLSPKSVIEMYSILEEARRQFGVTIILIEQNIARAVEFCDRTHLLSQGEIENTFSNDNLSELKKLIFI